MRAPQAGRLTQGPPFVGGHSDHTAMGAHFSSKNQTQACKILQICLQQPILHQSLEFTR